jgi:aspartate/methionine/tyrosine aminotransferase
MERWQSTYEHRVRYNLSESGVHPLTLSELMSLAQIDPADILLGYTQSDGSDLLKTRIAGLFEGAVPENVVATTGGAEANFVVLWRLISEGDRVVVAITPGTRLVVVTNPNNPTGAVLSHEAMDEIVTAAERAGAWLLVDEVYAGAEVAGPETPSFWGRYDRVIITGSLSKAYGLPGLRLGWIVGPEEMHEEFWSRKDYTTIAPSALSDPAAAAVLEPAVREEVLRRTRRIISGNLEILTAWLDAHGTLFRYVPPSAGAICYLRYVLDVNSSELAEALRVEKDVLVVPGDHFGMDRYLRIGFGNPAAELEEALGRIAELVETR